jgi:hypothetical protein
MLDPDAGPTCMSGSKRGAGWQRPAPTRQRGLRTPTFFAMVRLAEGLDTDPVALFMDAVARLRGHVLP